MQSALFDPQTAGGLLISLELEKAKILMEEIEGAKIVGSVETLKGKFVGSRLDNYLNKKSLLH